jgi:hypothetical protein
MFSTRESLITLAAIIWAAVSPHSARADIAASLFFSNPTNRIVAAGASIPVYGATNIPNRSMLESGDNLESIINMAYGCSDSHSGGIFATPLI